METLLINEYIADKGIFLTPEQLACFKNNKVQIIVRRISDEPSNKDIMKFAGILTGEEADELTSGISECRTINQDDWQ